MKIIRTKSGEISLEPLWVIFEDAYMYEHESLFRALWIFLTEFRQDRHMVG